ncbi:T9SS type A sorting domain-containing protein [Hymenobacter cellulosivorans]|uniref:T9SS type A sorting domain-containing protein n=1 Tax=Hymenobacter cellulosivorans TaxID=2932249 RepID=A0ABY4F8P8_9BACT|nr:T9SS type A sorting domain-containing protein [Hymenobacter cellulosivorans]UOQ52304.1 T9SS type A sorting domain-containing protein [Hymenobacter cellulosivorans]
MLPKQWDKSFGGTGHEELHVVQQTSDGGYILGGESSSGPSGDKTQPGKGNQDYWVVKVDASGNKQWDHSYGGAQEDHLRALQPTADGGYLLGGYSDSDPNSDKTQPSQGQTDYWIIKIDAAGNRQWDKTFGGNGRDYLRSLHPTSDGGFILGGESHSEASGDKTQPTHGPSFTADYWLVKIDAQGTKQWDRAYGGDDDDQLTCLQPTRDGGYILGGVTYSQPSGDKTQAHRGLADYWVIKVDAGGTKQWDQTFGTSSWDFLFAVQQTSDGGYILGGLAQTSLSSDKTQFGQGASDYWIIKLGATGTKQWDHSFGGTGEDYLSALHQTTDGGYMLAGYSASGSTGDKTQPTQGNLDYWLVKTDVLGNKVWDLSLGGNENDQLTTLLPATDGYLVAGYSYSGNTGNKTQASWGDSDYWIVKLQGGTTTSVRPALSQQLMVYPNPARTHLTLHLAETAPRTELRLSLLDATGREVYAQLLQATSPDLPIEIGPHPAGLYLLRVVGAQGYVTTQQVVLE